MSLVADIFDILLVDNSGDMIASSTLSTADINIQVASTDINAGRGDALIAVLHSGRTAEISLAEVEFKWDWLAKQLGQSITKEKATVWAMPKWYTAEDDTGTISITVSPAPLATGSGIKCYKADGTPVEGVVSGSEVTFATSVLEGDLIEVRGYKYETSTDAETILIDNKSFSSGMICILETLEISEDETEISRVQYIFDEVLLDGNINIQTVKERNPQATNVGLRAIKPKTSDNLGKVVRIPIA